MDPYSLLVGDVYKSQGGTVVATIATYGFLIVAVGLGGGPALVRRLNIAREPWSERRASTVRLMSTIGAGFLPCAFLSWAATEWFAVFQPALPWPTRVAMATHGLWPAIVLVVGGLSIALVRIERIEAQSFNALSVGLAAACIAFVAASVFPWMKFLLPI